MPHRRSPRSPAARAVTPARPATPDFAPVPIEPRHDGWTPARQIAFIEALAQSACVAEAAASAGMSRASAYALRRRADAGAFRAAWDFALDYAVHQLGEAVLARALHGVARPVFYQGEQIGERRYYDERLAMFVLRYRDSERYGAALDGLRGHRPPDALAQGLARACEAIAGKRARRHDDRLATPLARYQLPTAPDPQDKADREGATEAEVTRALERKLDALSKRHAREAATAAARARDAAGEANKGGTSCKLRQLRPNGGAIWRR